jgi:hypothetical protein
MKLELNHVYRLVNGTLLDDKPFRVIDIQCYASGEVSYALVHEPEIPHIGVTFMSQIVVDDYVERGQIVHDDI